MKGINYQNPEFYLGEVRSQFEIVDKVNINTLPTLHNIKDFYEVRMFSDGYIGVFNTRRKKYLKPHIGEYFYYSLMTRENKSKKLRMHRLVGFAWLDGFEEGKVIDHIDNDKFKNLKENLEWVTPKVNIHRAFQDGLAKGRPRVIKIPKAKLSALQISQISSKGRKGLTYEQVEYVFGLFDMGFNETFIAKKFNVSQPCVSQILSGKRWKDHPASRLYMSKLKAI